MYKTGIVSLVLIGGIVCCLSFMQRKDGTDLRAVYSQPVDKWPAPHVDSGIQWKELAGLPGVDPDFLELMEDPLIHLGKLLFFDPLLSGSSQISCSSCHDPEMGWAEKRSISLGHDHLTGKRNAPSLLNVFYRQTLFWDGRTGSLSEQALEPLTSHVEMNMDLKKLPKKLGKIQAYKHLFKEAYGSDKITVDRITTALSAFQQTIKSKQSAFDKFLAGDKKAMTDEALEGLHLFRTTARCMNCHHGPYFSDEQFHNIGLTYYKRELEDLGRYNVTKRADDVGKFKTPSLRDVMYTGPWMHNGVFDKMDGLLMIYNSGMQMINPTPAEKLADSLYPVTSPILQPLRLTQKEVRALVAFMEAISANPYVMDRPILPR